MSHWVSPVKALLSFFLESGCPLCQRSTAQLLCSGCQQQLQRCHQTGLLQQAGSLSVFAWAVYQGGVKRAIAALKYEQHPELARPLGHWLAHAWLAEPRLKASQSPIIVPIPLHASKQHQRGFNQAELLAAHFCERTGFTLAARGLERISQTEAQFGLSARDREQNLQNAFRATASLQRHRRSPVWLLDDIYTTGATARAAAQSLATQGISVKGIVTLAIAQKFTNRPEDSF